ncbi:MAG: 2-oxoacid:acceptor oxidoreductase family protein [Candidatus Bathyarchaeota archaeon]|nr:MAG: 2-oxoacid:acceptor oxidoreductase family protein [Candidatus Bathyarchaeota archaeon]
MKSYGRREKVPRRVEIRISGLGGQGVVLAGEILGRAAVYDGKHAVQTQSYGAEARGSAARSEVIISDEKIGFPKVLKCDILVAMSQSALDMHLKDLKAKGILLTDKDRVKTIPKTNARVFKVPATRIAEIELKSRIYANVVMLGAVIRITNLVTIEAAEKAIENSVPEETKKSNLEGFRKGTMQEFIYPI